MTTISVLVPFGADESEAGRHRAAVWAWCRRRWEGFVDARVVDEVVVGHDPLVGQCTEHFEWCSGGRQTHMGAFNRRPFSVARALNDAAKHAHGEHLLIFGADHVPDVKAVEWATHQLRGYAFARIYDRIAIATAAATSIILGNAAFPLDAADWREGGAPCPGVLGVRRAAFDLAGGYDKRFEGWGYEDDDFLARLSRTHRNGQRGTLGPSGLVLRELWHDDTQRDLNGPNRALYEGNQRG